MNIEAKHKEILSYSIIIIIGMVVAQHMNVVVSESMEPVLYKGDIILVDSNVDNIQVGDIIVYYGTWTPTPENIVHRVIKKETKENGTTVYITKGDNNQTNHAPDPLEVQPDQIRFKVVSIEGKPLKIPKLGYITIILRDL